MHALNRSMNTNNHIFSTVVMSTSDLASETASPPHAQPSTPEHEGMSTPAIGVRDAAATVGCSQRRGRRGEAEAANKVMTYLEGPGCGRASLGLAGLSLCASVRVICLRLVVSLQMSAEGRTTNSIENIKYQTNCDGNNLKMNVRVVIR